MKIVIYGDATPASGGWCYAQSFREMGHEVFQFQDPDSSGAHRTLPGRIYRKIFGKLPEPIRRKHIEELKRAICQFGPSILIVQKGLHLAFDDVMALRELGCWVCNINHDDFYSQNPNNWSTIQRNAIAAYDYIFATRSVNVGEIAPVNPRVEFFPFAYHPGIHRVVAAPPEERLKWDADVVFVGTYERPRAHLMEQLLRRTGVRLAIYGAQWSKLPTNSALRQSVRSSDLRFDDLCKAIGCARVALGFLRKENRDDYTQRTFEIPACGGVLLAERTERHSAYFIEGSEAEFFDANSADELCEKVDLLLNDIERRESMRSKGTQVVLTGRHTYVDRLSRLLTVYDEQG